MRGGVVVYDGVESAADEVPVGELAEAEGVAWRPRWWFFGVFAALAALPLASGWTSTSAIGLALGDRLTGALLLVWSAAAAILVGLVEHPPHGIDILYAVFVLGGGVSLMVFVLVRWARLHRTLRLLTGARTPLPARVDHQGPVDNNGVAPYVAGTTTFPDGIPEYFVLRDCPQELAAAIKHDGRLWVPTSPPNSSTDAAAHETADEALRRRFARGEIKAEELTAAAREPGRIPQIISSGPRNRWLPLTVLIAAAGLLVASVVGVTLGTTSPTAGNWYGPGHGGPVMPAPYHGRGDRPGAYGAPGTGPIRNMPEAAAAAQRFGATEGLHVGEVMQFSNGYYAELFDSTGNGATEVLVDPQSGGVRVEQGPAMMWNTRYGMMPANRPWPATIAPEQAQRLADQWLRENQPDLHAADATAFPGYYTLHTVRGDQVTGMLSVNAQNGAVWYHTWHGQFIAMQEQTHPS